MIITVMMLVFVVALVVGLPIAAAVGFSSIVPNLMDTNFITNMSYVIRSMISGVDSFTILALPLFMLSGDIMCKGGISKKLFDLFAIIVGKHTAGMPCAVILTCLFFGAISGSGPATCAAVGTMCLPILIDDLGYDRVFSGALLATAAGLAVIIPPSIPYVTICSVTGESIGNLMIAGIIPGIIIAGALMVYTFIYCRRKGEDKEKIKANYDKLRGQGILNILKSSFWALMFPVIILGGIYGGFVTPTEAACISVVYALLVSLLIYKSIRIRDLPGFLRGAVTTYAPLCVLLCMARAFAKVLTITGAPERLADYIVRTVSSPTMFILIVVFVLFIIGMFMDVGPANVILAPIFLPVAQAFGIHSIHFLLLMVCTLAVGFVTPPFGMNLFVVAPMINEPSFKVGQKAIPFIAANLTAILIIAFVPQVSLVLLG